MTPAPADETGIPAFLAGTVASMRNRRRAGEWDVVSADPGAVTAAAAALGAFRIAFPWALPTQVDMAGDRWEPGDGPVDDFVARHSGERAGVGLEADLDLRLRWRSPDGDLGWSRLPAAGRLVFDPSVPLTTFTVWPNLFTNEVYLYEPYGREFDRWIVPFHEAAHTNRHALRQALVAWESLTGGTMEDWESELVDGIERYGFAPDARPR